MFSFCCLLKAPPRSDPFWAQASLMWFFRTLPQNSGPDQRNANHPLVSSSYVFVSIVTVVSFYLTGRQLPVKKNADVLERTGTSGSQKNVQDEPSWTHIVKFADLIGSPTLEVNTSLPRWLGVFYVSRGRFPEEEPPRPKPWYWRYPWVFLGLFPRSCGVFTSEFFFIRRFFAWINQAPRFRSPSKPHRCAILPPLQVVPVENEAESQGTQQHHCSWSKHKTGSVSTVAPFFLLMAIYNSPCETAIVLPVWLGVGHTEITRRLHIKDHRSRPHFEAKMQVLPQVLQCGGYSAIPLQPAKSLPIGNPQRHDMCSPVFLPNELGTSQNCWGRFVSFTTCFKNTFIPFETIWSLKKIPIKKYWHPKYKIKPMNCINSSPSLSLYLGPNKKLPNFFTPKPSC